MANEGDRSQSSVLLSSVLNATSCLENGLFLFTWLKKTPEQCPIASLLVYYFGPAVVLVASGVQISILLSVHDSWDGDDIVSILSNMRD